MIEKRKGGRSRQLIVKERNMFKKGSRGERDRNRMRGRERKKRKGGRERGGGGGGRSKNKCHKLRRE